MNDKFMPERRPHVGTFVAATLIDAAIGAGAAWGIGYLGSSNPDLSPKDVAAQQSQALAVTGSVLGAGLLAWIYPLVEHHHNLPRTEFRDAWCGEWAPIADNGWTAVTSTRPIVVANFDPQTPWVPTDAEMTAREAQLAGKYSTGLGRRAGQLGQPDPGNVEKAPTRPRTYQGEPESRLPWASEVATGTALSATQGGWRVSAATLAPFVWAKLIQDAGGKMPENVPTALTALVVKNNQGFSGGASTVEINAYALAQFANGWACASANSPDVGTWLGAQSETVAAGALNAISGRCGDDVATLKADTCNRSMAVAGTWFHQGVTEAQLGPIITLCGAADWNRAAWRGLDESIAAADWQSAQRLLDEHKSLLETNKPNRAGGTGASSAGDAQRAITEGEISALTKSATEAAARDDAKNAIDALNGLPLLFSSHASALPQRASWLTAKRKEVSGLVATVVNHSIEEQDWTEAQQQVKDLTTLMGTAWATSTVAKIAKLESAAQARAEAEERREAAQKAADERREAAQKAADERREAAQKAADERRNSVGRLPASCYEKFGPSYERMTCAQLVNDCRRLMPFYSTLKCMQQGNYELYCAECF